MSEPIDSLLQYIAVDLAIGTLGETVFKHTMPDENDGSLDTCFAIVNTGGGPPTLAQGDNTNSPSFQLVSRSAAADTATGAIATVFGALHGLTEQTVHGTHFKLILFLQSNPISLGRDEKQRYVFSQNLRAFVAGVTR